MYQSAVMLDFHAHSVDVEMQIPPSRLGAVLGQPLTSRDMVADQGVLATYILDRFHAYSPGKAAWTTRLVGPILWGTADGAPYLDVHLVLTPPEGVAVRAVVIDDDVITDSLPAHAILVSVRSDWENSTFANEPDLVGILNGEQRSIEIDRSSGNWMHGFASVFHLGVRHIAEGTDHLLFLLALLLPASLLPRGVRWAEPASIRRSLAQILKIVTAFTLGHSLTLALAASGVVHVPAKPIEVLIALSILVSAIHAIRPLFPGREAFIAGGFGLIHGLAFASTLAELGLHRWERVASILAFNLGIEAMQLLVVVCVMPSLMLLSRTRAYTPFRIVGACFAGLAASGWIVNRALDWHLAVDSVVDTIARHPAITASVLFIFALATVIAENAFSSHHVSPLTLNFGRGSNSERP